MSDWRELEAKYLMHTYNRQPAVLVGGQGCRVGDQEGHTYLDLVAGIAVNCLGHAHPAIVSAVQAQVQTLIHTSNLYYTIPQIELAQLLVDNSCADRAFFCNSGAEANEGAFKLARKWGKLHRNGAFGIISAQASFHGRTLATVAATGQAKYQKPFLPMPDGFGHVPYNDLDAVQKATTDQTIGILLEPVQGESGVHPARQDYLQGVRAWCDQKGLLLIFDEIQTGLGRTGKLFGYQHFGVEPDIFTLAKGTAGGLPIGVLLAKERACVFEPGDHASTFGGSPLVCAAAVATVRTILDQNLAGHAAHVGDYFRAKLRGLRARLPLVQDVRGLGLMIGVDLARDVARQAVTLALANGLIINATGEHTLRMVPPLILSETEVDEAVEILERVLTLCD
jgi:acetylornithine/N-succinyldiaminopimelate aminotransferase